MAENNDASADSLPVPSCDEASLLTIENSSREKADNCRKRCGDCGYFNHVRRNSCTKCHYSFPKRKLKNVVENKQPASKTRERMLSYACQLHLKGYDVVILTRKERKTKSSNTSAWVWGTDGAGKAFTESKLCALAAKGFGSFAPTPISSLVSHSQTSESNPASPASVPVSVPQDIGETSTISSLSQSSSSVHVNQISSATPTLSISSSIPASNVEGLPTLSTSSCLSSNSQLMSLSAAAIGPSSTIVLGGQFQTTLNESQTPSCKESSPHASPAVTSSRVRSNQLNPVSLDNPLNSATSDIITMQPTCNAAKKQGLAVPQGQIVALLDESRRVHAYGIVTGQSTVHGRCVEPGHLALTVTKVLPTCSLKPAIVNSFEDDNIMEGAFYIWPMTRLALPKHLRPVTNS